MYGENCASIITVEYEVNGIIYQLKDSVKLVTLTIKLGSIPIGLHKVAVLPNAKPGTVVIVCYNPEKPRRRTYVIMRAT